MEVWLPWMKIVGLGSVVFLLVWLAFRYRAKYAYLPNWIVRTAGVVLSLPFLAMSLFLGSAQSCEDDGPLVKSPDGKHVARMMVWGSVPSGTSLQIIERQSWSPRWDKVSGASSIGTPLEPIEPTLLWTDNSHLNIDYPNSENGTGFECISRQLGDIWIVCKTHSMK